MTETTLRKMFLAWWQPRNPKGRLWRNNSGAIKTETGFLRFGIPDGGGGSDLLGIEKGRFTAYEVKTLNDTLKKKQADFLSVVISLGGIAGLVLENPYNGRGFDVKPWNENLRYLVKG